jgi:hypothetical protein
MITTPPAARLIISALLAACPVAGLALQPMADYELSGVNGQDGIVVSFQTDGLSADSVVWTTDAGTVREAGIQFDNMTISGVGAGGLSPGGVASIATSIDAYTANGTSGIALNTAWSRARTEIGAIRHASVPGQSMGRVAVDSEGSFFLRGANGLLDQSNNTSAMRLQLNNGNFFYRQGDNEFVWNNFNVDIGFDQGAIGVTNNALVMRADRLDWNILFDFGYRKNATTPFTLGTAGGPDEFIPMLRYGWEGGLTDVRASVRGGGVWYGGDLANRSQGINASWQNNFADDFVWIIGNAGGNEAQIRFGKWVNLPNIQYAWNSPNLTLDFVNAGQEPPGFLYKGNLVKLNAVEPAVAIAIRDLSFLAYNTEVEIIDDPDPVRSYDWGLIYTLGRLNADLLLYPGSRTSTEGFRFDAILAVESPGAWNENSHFLLADTAAGVAVGFINTQFLVEIKDTSFELTGGAGGGLRLHSLGGVRWSLDAVFGGGELDDLSLPVKFADISLLLDASTLDLRLLPPPAGQSYLGFEYNMRLANTSFITIAEPSRPDVRFTIGGISGDVGVSNGRIEVLSASASPEGVPKLVFQQDLEFGLTAGTQPVVISEFSIGPRFIGSMAIPGGRWYGGLALKEQSF